MIGLQQKVNRASYDNRAQDATNTAITVVAVFAKAMANIIAMLKILVMNNTLLFFVHIFADQECCQE